MRLALVALILAVALLIRLSDLRSVGQDLPPAWRNYRDAGLALAEEAEEDAVISTRKPHWLAIYAKRRAIMFPRAVPDSIWAHWVREGVDYVVFEQLGFPSTRQFLLPAIEQYKPGWEEVWRSESEPITAVFRRLEDE